MSNKNVSPTILFETSWEVCNKVGGIYTVLSSKAKVLNERLGDKMIFVGPDVWTSQNPSPFFKESKALLKNWRQSANLPYGISVRVGKWMVPGNPVAILVNFDLIPLTGNIHDVFNFEIHAIENYFVHLLFLLFRY